MEKTALWVQDKYIQVGKMWIEYFKKLTKFLASIQWRGLYALFNNGIYYDLKEKNHDDIKDLLAGSYYIILTYRKTHLTSWLIGVLCFLKTFKWPNYVHALMNCDGAEKSKQWKNFKFVEATNVGVHYSTFMEVFDCDRVCLLKPKNISIDDWGDIMEGLLKQHGKKYDDLFDLMDSEKVSCVELCRLALQNSKNYNEDFKNFEQLIHKIGNLTPQMFRDCEDFEVVYEYKK